MKINLTIERLILDGLPFEGLRGPYLQAAVEQELTRLLTDSPLATPLNTSGELAYVKGGSFKWAEHATPAGLGQQIAAAVYSGLGGRP